MEFVSTLTEYKLLGTLLALALIAIAYLHRASERNTRKFASQIKSMGDESNTNNQLIADKFVALHRESMQNFKDMHARSLEIISHSIIKTKN